MKPWNKEDFQNIHVVVTPEQSEQLQKYLYSLGIKSKAEKPTNFDYKHLFVNSNYIIEFSFDLSFDFSERTILFENIVFEGIPFKIGDKIIIDKNKDILNVFGDFHNQELIVTNIGESLNNGYLIWFKSTVTDSEDHGHQIWFKKSPQIGDRVKIISHGIESLVESDFNKSNDYFGYEAIILDVSYLDEFPYRVRVNEPVGFVDIFVKDVEILNSQIKSVEEQLSINDYAKYQVGEMDNNYVDEIMSTHYNNINKLNNQLSGKTKPEVDGFWESYTAPQPLYKSNFISDDVTISNTITEDSKLRDNSNDMVNKPKHYNTSKYEVIDVIEDWGFDKDSYLFNVIKYVARSPHKGKELEDLKKLNGILIVKFKI